MLPAPARPPFTIVRAAHVELVVKDLARSRAFYVDLLGFNPTLETAGALYLRGIEERCHHSLVLRQGDTPAVAHLSFRVAGPADLAAAERFFAGRGLPTRWVEAGSEPAQGRALRVQDPLGFPIEFYAEMERAEWLLQQFHRHRGPGVMRIDHFNCFTPDVQAGYDWWAGTLGFRCSEYTADDTERPWAVWLHSKPNVHDLALMNGQGPRLHHIGFWVQDTMAVLRACDILAAAGWAGAIERGPGRHGISNAFFLYLRDPDGHRIELYTGDYLTADPDHVPLRWSLNDPRRQTFWGHIAPPSWFEEAMPVLNFDGTGVMATAPGLLQQRPDYVT